MYRIGVRLVEVTGGLRLRAHNLLKEYRLISDEDKNGR